MNRKYWVLDAIFFAIIISLILAFPDFGLVIACLLFGVSFLVAVAITILAFSGQFQVIKSGAKAKNRTQLIAGTISGMIFQGVYIYVVLSTFWNPFTVIASSLILTVSLAIKASNISILWGKLKA